MQGTARVLSGHEVAEFRSAIWNNYRVAARVFPWRTTDDPYAVMASEFMLQQTQTARVVPKYCAWLERFPTVQSVAESPLAPVLAAWNGLGYNRRAKFLWLSCRAIVEEHGGTVPRNPAVLDALPGIGAYTARAIATFSYNAPEVFIETNIRAVFIHFFFSGQTEPVPDAALLPLVAQTLDSQEPRTWYYALMDYGAELKKLTVNPSRKSSAYVKQAPFKGSRRQARGAVLRQLAQNGMATAAQVAAAEGIAPALLEEAAHALEQEGLVTASGGMLRLAGTDR